MKLLADRLAETQRLSDELAGRRPTKTDVKALKELIADETESMQRSKRISETPTHNAQYRKNMGVAASNSLAVIGHLEAALKALLARDTTTTVQELTQVLLQRGKKATQRPSTASKLYQEYLVETDTEFHGWLKKNGHEDVLKDISRAHHPKPARRRVEFKDSNRPEDYE